MSLFVCSKCGVMDNTALAKGFWLARIEKQPELCSECGKPGLWHAQFARKTPEEWGLILGTDRYLYKPEDLKPGGYRYPAVIPMSEYLESQKNEKEKQSNGKKRKRR